jgi:hypothetical protein
VEFRARRRLGQAWKWALQPLTQSAKRCNANDSNLRRLRHVSGSGNGRPARRFEFGQRAGLNICPTRRQRQGANFLFDDIANGWPGTDWLGVFVPSEAGDDVADASVTWPSSRAEIPFGTITLTARVDDQAPERRKIIFDPVPRVDGIDSSGDPLTEVRADVYLLSGRRRRAVLGDGKR